MTNEEMESFIDTFEKVGDGWDIRCVAMAYRHLPLKEAIQQHVRNMKAYCEAVKEPTMYFRSDSPIIQ